MKSGDNFGFNVRGPAFRHPRRNAVFVGAGLAGALALLSIYAVDVPTSVGVQNDKPVQPMHMHMNMAGEGADQGARPRTTVTTLTCQKLPNVPGKSITVARVDFPPNGYTPAHTHPGSVTAFVLKGTVRSQLEGSPTESFVVGQTWFEPPGTVHLFAENASATEPASILATFVADDDCGPLTVLK
ncbi:cupin domain-containing protein [Paraburkholderia edwinii]|nr:cupin domain-containing protein [Paraburkholderia edwinii]